MVPLIEYGLGYRSRNKVQPDHFKSTITTLTLNPNSNPKTDPNPQSKNNVCSTKRHRNEVQHSVIYKLLVIFLGTAVGL